MELKPFTTTTVTEIQAQQDYQQRQRSNGRNRFQVSKNNTFLSDSRINEEQSQHGYRADEMFMAGDDPKKQTVEPPRSFRRAMKSMSRLWQDTWMAELFSCLVALVALVMMVIVLAVYQGRPMPQWPRAISLNTLVAVFSAVLKAALMMPVGEGISQLKYLWFREMHPLIDLEDFDSASRGPLGSFLFMLQRKKQYVKCSQAVPTNES